MSRPRGPGAGRLLFSAEVVLQGILALVLVPMLARDTRQVAPGPSDAAPARALSFREIIEPPIVRPTVRAASHAGLPPDEPVIGVIVGGKARAYQVRALEGRTKHLVNDVVAEVPVSVSYCNLTACTRVYAGPRGAAPLDLAVAGLLDDEMILKAGGTLFYQESGKPVSPEVLRSTHNPVAVAHARDSSPAAATSQAGTSHELPYITLAPELTTWQAWLEQHPDSDVYIGVGAQDQPAPGSDPAP